MEPLIVLACDLFLDYLTNDLWKSGIDEISWNQLSERIRKIVMAIRAKAAQASVNIRCLVGATLSQSLNKEKFIDIQAHSKKNDPSWHFQTNTKRLL